MTCVKMLAHRNLQEWGTSLHVLMGSAQIELNVDSMFSGGISVAFSRLVVGLGGV